MKRFFAIPLLFLYTLAISGAMIQVHLCGQEIDSWNFGHQQEKNSSCCCDKDEAKTAMHEDEDDNCCEDATVVVKAVSDQLDRQAIQVLFSTFKAWIPASHFSFYLDFQPEQEVVITHEANAPPGLWQDIPLFKLHQRFIYHG